LIVELMVAIIYCTDAYERRIKENEPNIERHRNK
jgi:hypothetical protein